MSQVGYYIAKIKGCFSRKEKHIILNEWFQKQGVNFRGDKNLPYIFKYCN